MALGLPFSIGWAAGGLRKHPLLETRNTTLVLQSEREIWESEVRNSVLTFDQSPLPGDSVKFYPTPPPLPAPVPLPPPPFTKCVISTIHRILTLALS